jgi:hypothetical protein
LRKVHTAESIVEIAHLRNVLEADGIACLVRNDRLGGVVGEIPFVECWPELWVLETGNYLRAKSLVDDVLRTGPALESWRCASCGESIEGQFEVCWNCGASARQGVGA